MTKNNRNNTEKSYSTTENGMPEGLKFNTAKKETSQPMRHVKT